MFEHPLIIILIVVAGILRWLYEKSQASKEEGPQRPIETAEPPIPRAAPNSEEERIRRFLEALGQPTTSPPPPKVVPKREPPRRTILPQPTLHRLPPLTTVPPPLPPAISEIPHAMPPPLIEQRVFQPTISKETVFEVQDVGVESLEDRSPEGRRAAARQRALLPDLTSPQSLRSAIVLREIFGPPRGLQMAETIL